MNLYTRLHLKNKDANADEEGALSGELKVNRSTTSPEVLAFALSNASAHSEAVP